MRKEDAIRQNALRMAEITVEYLDPEMCGYERAVIIRRLAGFFEGALERYEVDRERLLLVQMGSRN